mgnify:FL=1
MGKCLVTKLDVSVDLGNKFKVLGYESSFEADSKKNAIFGIDHARVKVFGTSEPCVNNNTKEVLGTEFSVEDEVVVKFPCGDGVKVFLDLANTNRVIGDEYSTKYFKNFHLEKVHKVTEFYLAMRDLSLDVDNVFDEPLELETILNPQIVTNIILDSEKTGAVKTKFNINNFNALKKIKIGDRIGGDITIDLDSIPESLIHIEYISVGNVNAIGSINSITKTNMERIQVIGSPKVTGSLEKVVEGMWVKGRRSGACTIIIQRTSATFNGNVPNFDTTAKFDNSGVTIYKSDMPSGEIVATYNGTSWSYN